MDAANGGCRVGSVMMTELSTSSRPSQNLRLGRYLLQERLAHGGMGEVYRAAAYGAAGVVKTVCVKRIRAEKAEKNWRVESFIEEARLSMQLNHANIVSVFDFGVADGGYYLAMEWIDGVDLMAFVRRGVRVPTSLVAYVGAETCRALDRAHTGTIDGVHGIVHRDVKPSNILLSRSGEVKLADFGIATLVGGQRSIAGTPGYMSPEQREGGVVDARTDIYGLGVSLLEFAIGRRAKDVAAALEQVEDEDLRALLAWLVEPDLEKRASSAHQIGQEFERMVGRALAAGEEHPRDILAAYVSALAKMKVSAPVDEELGATASLAFGAHVPREPKRALTERFAADFEGSEATTREDEPSDLSSSSTMARAFSKRIGLRVLLSILALVTVAIAAFVVAFPNPRPPHPTGRLDVNVEPRAAIYVDGVFLGESPLHGLELPAGEHEIRVENHELGVVKVKRVRIPEGRTHVYEAELR